MPEKTPIGIIENYKYNILKKDFDPINTTIDHLKEQLLENFKQNLNIELNSGKLPIPSKILTKINLACEKINNILTDMDVTTTKLQNEIKTALWDIDEKLKNPTEKNTLKNDMKKIKYYLNNVSQSFVNKTNKKFNSTLIFLQTLNILKPEDQKKPNATRKTLITNFTQILKMKGLQINLGLEHDDTPLTDKTPLTIKGSLENYTTALTNIIDIEIKSLTLPQNDSIYAKCPLPPINQPRMVMSPNRSRSVALIKRGQVNIDYNSAPLQPQISQATSLFPIIQTSIRTAPIKSISTTKCEGGQLNIVYNSSTVDPKLSQFTVNPSSPIIQKRIVVSTNKTQFDSYVNLTKQQIPTIPPKPRMRYQPLKITIMDSKSFNLPQCTNKTNDQITCETKTKNSPTSTEKRSENSSEKGFQ